MSRGGDARLVYHVAKSGLCVHNLSFLCKKYENCSSDIGLGEYMRLLICNGDCLATNGSFFVDEMFLQQKRRKIDRRNVYGTD